MEQDASAAFFSYCREDSDFALQLATGLKEAGASVWLDQLDIIPGQRWDRSVEDALKNCPRLIVILSPTSVESTNVMDEVSFALEEHKTVIPVIYKDCEIPFRLRRLQYVDFKQGYAHGFQELLKVLTQRKATFSSVPDQIRHDISATRERSKSWAAAKIGAAAFSILIIAFLLYWRLQASRSNEQTQETQKPEQTEQQKLRNRLFGTWNNDNPQTNGIKKLEIWQDGDVVRVQVWAKQDLGDLIGGLGGGGKSAAIAAAGEAATPIDWGTTKAILSKNSATAVWDQATVVRNMKMTPDAGRLQVVVDNKYKDDRPPRRLLEYFVRKE